MSKLTVKDVGKSDGYYEITLKSNADNEEFRIYKTRDQIIDLANAFNLWLLNDEPNGTNTYELGDS